MTDPEPVGAFAGATHVARRGEGRYAAVIAPGWDIADNANGGYLLAILGRALCDATGRPDPVSLTGQFLSPAKAGPVTISTDLVKTGRRFTTATARLETTERPLVVALGAFGDLDGAEGPVWSDREPPELPDPDDCTPVEPREPFPPPFMGKVELRLHPDDGGFAAGGRSGRPLMRGWFRLRGSEPLDPVALLCAADAFPPTIFNADLPVAWTPTVELTVHVRARPAPGWLRCRFSTHFVSSGFVEEEGELWDSRDRLVAQSRQLALVPRA